MDTALLGVVRIERRPTSRHCWPGASRTSEVPGSEGSVDTASDVLGGLDPDSRTVTTSNGCQESVRDDQSSPGVSHGIETPACE